MLSPRFASESPLADRFDLLTANVLVWIARAGHDGELTTEAHVYFFERYQRLADRCRRQGHQVRAERLQAKADRHHEYFDDPTPPCAAAMAMARPKRWLSVDAVSHVHLRDPDDAA